MNRHLVVLLSLLVLAAGAQLIRPDQVPDPPARFERLPAYLGHWNASAGAPLDVLPIDPRAIQNLRRTYVRNGQTVMLSVAQYPSWNHPDHRPLADYIAPQRGVADVVYTAVEIQPAGGPNRPTTPVTVNLVSLDRRQHHLSVAYWYQLANEPISGEYRLRFRLFVDTLRGRPRPLALVRAAGEHRDSVLDFLTALYPRLRDLLVS